MISRIVVGGVIYTANPGRNSTMLGVTIKVTTLTCIKKEDVTSWAGMQDVNEGRVRCRPAGCSPSHFTVYQTSRTVFSLIKPVSFNQISDQRTGMKGQGRGDEPVVNAGWCTAAPIQL